MSSFLFIVFQSGRIFEISENALDSGLPFVEKYLLLKKLHFPLPPPPPPQILQLNNTCIVKWSGKADTEVSMFISLSPCPAVGGGGIVVGI